MGPAWASVQLEPPCRSLSAQSSTASLTWPGSRVAELEAASDELRKRVKERRSQVDRVAELEAECEELRRQDIELTAAARHASDLEAECAQLTKRLMVLQTQADRTAGLEAERVVLERKLATLEAADRRAADLELRCKQLQGVIDDAEGRSCRVSVCEVQGSEDGAPSSADGADDSTTCTDSGGGVSHNADATSRALRYYRRRCFELEQAELQRESRLQGADA